MTHHFNEPLWQQVRKERMRRKGLITVTPDQSFRVVKNGTAARFDEAPPRGTTVIITTKSGG